MKKYLGCAIFFLSVCTGWCTNASREDEILIELNGDATAADTSPADTALWKINATQLARTWRGTTREQLLYRMPIVSTKDRTVSNQTNTYALVEYGDATQFRKFLFRAKSPQTLLAVAATPADVLAVNEKYHINIGLAQTAFENFYKNQATLQQDTSFPAGTFLYRLSSADKTIWLLFENKQLAQTFLTDQQKEEFIKARQAKQAQKTSAATTASTAPAKTRTAPRKALLFGGTAWDRAYMPRVVNPNPALLPDSVKNKKQK